MRAAAMHPALAPLLAERGALHPAAARGCVASLARARGRTDALLADARAPEIALAVLLDPLAGTSLARAPVPVAQTARRDEPGRAVPVPVRASRARPWPIAVAAARAGARPHGEPGPAPRAARWDRVAPAGAELRAAAPGSRDRRRRDTASAAAAAVTFPAPSSVAGAPAAPLPTQLLRRVREAARERAGSRAPGPPAAPAAAAQTPAAPAAAAPTPDALARAVGRAIGGPAEATPASRAAVLAPGPRRGAAAAVARELTPPPQSGRAPRLQPRDPLARTDRTPVAPAATLAAAAARATHRPSPARPEATPAPVTLAPARRAAPPPAQFVNGSQSPRPAPDAAPPLPAVAPDVQWLDDDDALAGRLQRLLTRQAHARGIDLS